jgi:hypothetical protein
MRTSSRTDLGALRLAARRDRAGGRAGRGGEVRRALVAALAWLTGCATGPSETPAEVTRAQIAAIEAGDEEGAAALLTPEARRRAPLWPAREALPDARSVAEVERTAVWQDGRELELVRTAHGWAIRRGVLALFRVDSAEGALSAFGRALEARDFGLVLALMPEESRRLHGPGRFEAAMTAREGAWRELGQAIAARRIAWSVRAEARAEAVVTVGGPDDRREPSARERVVVLVREDAGWKVFDVRPWSEYIAP